MVSLFNAASMAGLLTALFALRFAAWRRHGLLAGYFTLFFVAEGIGQYVFLGDGMLGPEIGITCLGITALVLAGLRVVKHIDAASAREAQP